ncbi:MAG: hypothetical protein MUE86_03140 [Thiobacillaceae bacterium]|jgi:hypothetical protein|nr:hypothetical protein [Thiobacillaceae bacterium]
MPTTSPQSGASPDPFAFARAFVRESLGCGCPDELLAQLGIERRPGGPTVLSVGGRLLVHIRVCAREEDLERVLAGWLEEGLAQRDALGFHRFRLVLAAADPNALRARAEAWFATRSVDERTHLHLLRAAEAAPLLPA